MSKEEREKTLDDGDILDLLPGTRKEVMALLSDAMTADEFDGFLQFHAEVVERDGVLVIEEEDDPPASPLSAPVAEPPAASLTVRFHVIYVAKQRLVAEATVSYSPTSWGVVEMDLDDPAQPLKWRSCGMPLRPRLLARQKKLAEAEVRRQVALVLLRLEKSSQAHHEKT